MATTPSGPPPADATRKLVKRLLLLVGLGGLAILGAAFVFGYMQYRMYRHKADFRDSVQEVTTEWDERQALKAEAHRLFAAREFASLDTRIRALRADGGQYPSGITRLNVFYQGLSAPIGKEGWDERQWLEGLDLARRWVEARPDSAAAHVTLADLWMGYAWDAREGGWTHPKANDPAELFRERVGHAWDALVEAETVGERCPRVPAATLRLMLFQGGKEDERRIHAAAVAEFPDDQTIDNNHLRFLHTGWHGAPGEVQVAALELLKRPDGRRRLARALWFMHTANAWETGFAPWADVKVGLAELRAAHPDSLELVSISCLFAASYRDRDETRRMLEILGRRRDPHVWHSRAQFADIYHWATWEEYEQEGGDPLARFFRRVMGR